MPQQEAANWATAAKKKVGPFVIANEYGFLLELELEANFIFKFYEYENIFSNPVFWLAKAEEL